MVKLMYVCLGNICRSPIGEAIFNDLIAEKGLSGELLADSAGTAGYHIGQSPDHRTLDVLEKHGITTNHKGQKLSISHLENYDHIIVMDEENFEHVHNMYHKQFGYPPPADKLFLMRDYDPTARGVQEVPDPYYGSKQDIEEVFTMLKRSNESLLQHLTEKYNLEAETNEGGNPEETT